MTAYRHTPDQPVTTPMADVAHATRQKNGKKPAIYFHPIENLFSNIDGLQLELQFNYPDFSIKEIPYKELRELPTKRMDLCMAMPWITNGQSLVLTKMAEFAPDFQITVDVVKRIATDLMMKESMVRWHITELCKKGIIKRKRIAMQKMIGDTPIGKVVSKTCYIFNRIALLLCYYALQFAQKIKDGETAVKMIESETFDDFTNDENPAGRRENPAAGHTPAMPGFTPPADVENSGKPGISGATKIPGNPEFSTPPAQPKFRETRNFDSGNPGTFKATKGSKGLEREGLADQKKFPNPLTPPQTLPAPEKRGESANCKVCGFKIIRGYCMC